MDASAAPRVWAVIQSRSRRRAGQGEKELGERYVHRWQRAELEPQWCVTIRPLTHPGFVTLRCESLVEPFPDLPRSRPSGLGPPEALDVV